MPASKKSPVFLKWAGGQGSLIKQYITHFPLQGARYFEPFMSGEAVFFTVESRFQFCSLSDANAEMVNCYLMVRDQLEDLIRLLAMHQTAHRKEHYYVVREMDRGNLLQYTPLQRAARFIYLNKTCFSKLWRQNSQGYFNIPIGSNRKPPILKSEVLQMASQALQGVEIVQRDPLSLEQIAQAGDTIYFDPPYDPVISRSGFACYVTRPFGDPEQAVLADLYRRLDERGCSLILRNADTEFVRDLYRGFSIIPIKVPPTTKTNRSPTLPEVLIVNTSPLSPNPFPP